MSLARGSPRKQDRAGQIFGSRRGRRYRRIAHERTRAETGIADVAGRQHAAVPCVDTYSHAIVGHFGDGSQEKSTAADVISHVALHAQRWRVVRDLRRRRCHVKTLPTIVIRLADEPQPPRDLPVDL
jgi:hypothetical protein